MSHIEVPPLKRPRSDYRRPPSSSKILPTIVNKRRHPHNSLQELPQASMQHNSDLGVFTGSLDKRKRKLMKQGRDEAVGPFSVSHPTGNKKMLKPSFMDNDDDWDPPSRFKKRPRPITISDDDDLASPPPRAIISSNTLASQNPKPKVKATPKLPISTPIPRPRPLNKPKSVHAKYNLETDVVTLQLEDIRPVSLEVLTLNTRFLRQSLIGNDVNTNDLDPVPRNPLDSQLLHNVSTVVRPPQSAQSSMNGQTFGSGSDYSSDAIMPSDKALGKRRAISPSMSISATTTTTTPHHLPVPPYSADIQMTFS